MISSSFTALLACSLSLALSLAAQEEKPSAEPAPPPAGESPPAPAKETKKAPPELMPWEQEQAAMQAKLEKIILPLLEPREMPLKDMVKLLSSEARKHDPEGKGVEVALKVAAAKPPAKASKKGKAGKDAPAPAPAPPADAPRDITLTLKDASLAEALQLTADLSGTHLRIDGKGVTFLSKSVYDTELVERTWKVDAAAFTDDEGAPMKFPAKPKETSVKHFMEMRGIVFAPGTFARYNPKTSVLTAKNIEDQLELVQAFVDVAREGKKEDPEATPEAPENEAPKADSPAPPPPPAERPD